MTTEQIDGTDVIGRPGQNLTPLELRALVGLADGQPPSALAESLQIAPAALRSLEASLKGKLGAKNHPHLISRGFILGVLSARALAMLLAISCALSDGNDLLRPRTHKRVRTTGSTSLTLRTGRGGSSGHGHGPASQIG